MQRNLKQLSMNENSLILINAMDENEDKLSHSDKNGISV